jgi:hypothetical protein
MARISLLIAGQGNNLVILDNREVMENKECAICSWIEEKIVVC